MIFVRYATLWLLCGLLVVVVVVVVDGCHFYTQFKLDGFKEDNKFEYNYWTEPTTTPETTDEEAVLLFGGIYLFASTDR